MNIITTGLKWLKCHVLQDHNWTCKAEQGIAPDGEKIRTDTTNYFWEYARGYCKDCGKPMPRWLPE